MYITLLIYYINKVIYNVIIYFLSLSLPRMHATLLFLIFLPNRTTSLSSYVQLYIHPHNSPTSRRDSFYNHRLYALSPHAWMHDYIPPSIHPRIWVHVNTSTYRQGTYLHTHSHTFLPLLPAFTATQKLQIWSRRHSHAYLSPSFSLHPHTYNHRYAQIYSHLGIANDHFVFTGIFTHTHVPARPPQIHTHTKANTHTQIHTRTASIYTRPAYIRTYRTTYSTSLLTYISMLALYLFLSPTLTHTQLLIWLCTPTLSPRSQHTVLLSLAFTYMHAYVHAPPGTHTPYHTHTQTQTHTDPYTHGIHTCTASLPKHIQTYIQHIPKKRKPTYLHIHLVCFLAYAPLHQQKPTTSYLYTLPIHM